MTGRKDSNSDMEIQLRDWGQRVPSCADVSGLTFEALSQIKEKRNARFQRVATASVLVGAVMLVAWIGTWGNDAASLRLEPKNSMVVDLPPNEQNELDERELATSMIDTQSVIYTKAQNADRELQEDWVEAKRNVARDQILQQWLAENL